ncbi:MAG: hypothetical protein EXR83_11955 [Gammaproteobacteria bacterium]|nr:hypothetical protein [Gammaproteobacteria bacterium]
MKFGLIYELSTPRLFTRETQKALDENAIEPTVLADALHAPRFKRALLCVPAEQGGARKL